MQCDVTYCARRDDVLVSDALRYDPGLYSVIDRCGCHFAQHTASDEAR